MGGFCSSRPPPSLGTGGCLLRRKPPMKELAHGRQWRLHAPGTLHRLPRPQPVTREKWYWCDYGGSRYSFHWRPWVGLYVVSAIRYGGGRLSRSVLAPCFGGFVVKRQAPVTAVDVIRPALSRESKLLGKLPTFCAFLVDTVYDDGTARTPGGLWLDNKGVVLEMILRNPDSGARLPLVAPTLDELFALAETALKADAPPWQPDRYLMEQLVKRGKKK